MSEVSPAAGTRERFDWNETMSEIGFDTPDANDNWGASRVQMDLFLDIHGLNWGHVRDAVDRGVLQPIKRTVERSPENEEHVERTIRYRNLEIEERGSR